MITHLSLGHVWCRSLRQIVILLCLLSTIYQIFFRLSIWLYTFKKKKILICFKNVRWWDFLYGEGAICQLKVINFLCLILLFAIFMFWYMNVLWRFRYSGEIIVYSRSTINACFLLSHEWWVSQTKFMVGPTIHMRGGSTHLWYSGST